MKIQNLGPIDIIESIAARIGYKQCKLGENEIAILLSRGEAEYQLFVDHRMDSVYEALYFSCDVGVDFSEKEYESTAVAVVKANERSWMGHFDIVSQSSRILYSFTMPFASAFNFDDVNTEAIFNVIIDECERFRQYFAIATDMRGRMSDMSINTLFFEPMGEA